MRAPGSRARMVDAEELVALERRGWEALATKGAAAGFHDEVLAEHVVMLLPGGTVIDDRAAVVESMSGPPWASYDLDGPQVLPLGPDAALVHYRATATRDGTTYEALFSSTYVRTDAGWRMAVHQQTPIG